MFHTPPTDNLRVWQAEALRHSYNPEADTNTQSIATPHEMDGRGSPRLSAPSPSTSENADETYKPTTIDSSTEPPQVTLETRAVPRTPAEIGHTGEADVLSGAEMALEREAIDALALPDLPQEIIHSVDRFVLALTEPRYQEPLTPVDVAAMFQTFYRAHSQVVLMSLRESVAKTYTTLPEGDYRKNSKVILLKTAAELRHARVLRANPELFTHQIIRYTELSERYLFGGIHQKLFTFQNHSGAELEFNANLNNKMASLKSQHIPLVRLLDSGPHSTSDHCFANDELLQLYYFRDSLNEVATLNQVFTPRAKLLSLLRTHTSIIAAMAEINQALRSEHPTILAVSSSNDYVLPLLIYHFINAGVEDLYLNFLFIRRFFNEADLVGELNYSLTNFEAVVMYLSQVTAPELALVSSEPLLTAPLPYRDPFLETPSPPGPLGPANPSVNNYKTFLKANRARSDSAKSVTSLSQPARAASVSQLSAIDTLPDAAMKNLTSALDSGIKGFMGRFNRSQSLSQSLKLEALPGAQAPGAEESELAPELVVDPGDEASFFSSPQISVSSNPLPNPLVRFGDALSKLGSTRSSDSLRLAAESAMPEQKEASRSRAVSLLGKVGLVLVHKLESTPQHHSSDSVSSAGSVPLKVVFPIARPALLPLSLARYAISHGCTKEFEDLTVSELRDLYTKYQRLVIHVDETEGFESPP